MVEFIRTWEVRVLHYAKIPESILARVNPGTRYRRRIEAGRLARREGRREGKRGKENERENDVRRLGQMMEFTIVFSDMADG